MDHNNLLRFVFCSLLTALIVLKLIDGYLVWRILRIQQEIDIRRLMDQVQVDYDLRKAVITLLRFRSFQYRENYLAGLREVRDSGVTIVGCNGYKGVE
jgi:hypothetical protein